MVSKEPDTDTEYMGYLGCVLTYLNLSYDSFIEARRWLQDLNYR